MSWIDTYDAARLFVVAEWLIRFAALAVVPFRRTPAAAKGWLLLIFFEPVLGSLAYALIGRARLPRWQRRRLAQLPDVLRPAVQRFANDPSIQQPDVGPGLDQAVTLAENLGRSPILGGNEIELLVNYDATFARLVADIDRANHHVHLLFYIVGDDAATAPVFAALGRAVQRGVRCRVLADAIGSRRPLRTLTPKLRALGVDVRPALPISLLPWRKARLDLRNHRKIAVIDGRVAYTGSQNLIAADFKPGVVYEDVMARVAGPVVLELQYVFSADWYLETGEAFTDAAYFPRAAPAGTVAAQALPSGPAFPTSNNQRLIVALVHGARRRVVLTTPYFVPDEPLLQALETAVLRGVDVRLVVTAGGNQPIVALAQESYYTELLRAGVAVQKYRAGFLHAKHLTVDDAIAVVGTSNLDIRSFVLNAEVLLLLYDRDTTTSLIAEQERTLAGCDTLTLAEWQQRPFRRKLAQNVARLFSPLF